MKPRLYVVAVVSLMIQGLRVEAQQPTYANIAGTYNVSETVTLKSTDSTGTDSETYSGTGTITIVQTGNAFSYSVTDPVSGQAFVRSGTVDGNTITFGASSPIIVFQSTPGLTVSQNVFLGGGGTIQQGRIDTTASGRASGTYQGSAFLIEATATEVFTGNVSPLGPPVITASPQSRSIGAGGSASLTVTASGTLPLTYQWRHDGTDISGATSATYTITGAQAADAGNYLAVVTNPFGSVTSATAVVTVGLTPAFTSQPQNLTVAAGLTANLSVGVTGSPTPTLRWQYKFAHSSDWFDLQEGFGFSGVTTTNLTITDVEIGRNGDQCRCVATNDIAAVTSDVATLTVTAPPAIFTPPVDQTLSMGETVTLSVGVTGTAPFAYAWRKDGGLIAGATSNVLIISNAQPSDSGRYAVRVTNAFGSVESTAVEVSVWAPYVISTFAGSSGAAGSADGTGSAARFTNPWGVAVDATGTVYVADQNNHIIRKIAPTGETTTIAGTAGSAGSADGTGAAARFNTPRGVAVDATGNLYITDSANHTVRKITPQGDVTTLAGQAGTAGSANGTGVAARFNTPRGICVDALGNVFVADSGNQLIREIDSAGAVTTLAGAAGAAGYADGEGPVARFSNPSGLAIDPAGYLYVADTGNHVIRKISPDNVVVTLAGTAGTPGSLDGIGLAAAFKSPRGVAVDATGAVYVTEDNQDIRKIFANDVVTTLAGLVGDSGASDGTGMAAHFFNPTGIAVSADGKIYICDFYNNTIRLGIPPATGAPLVRTPVQSRFATIGASTTLAVGAAGDFTLAYQWRKDGVILDGATDSMLVIPAVSATDAGSYDVVLTSAGGSATAAAAELVLSSGGNGRLSNLSVRSIAGSGSQTLILGFVIAGSGPKPMLIRGIGPTLGDYGVGNALADPRVRLFDSFGAEVDANDDWGGSPALTAHFDEVGAFVPPVNSKDAALFTPLSADVFTFHVLSNTSNAGVALAELYDADLAAPASLVNISARTQVGTGENILIAGFVISGSAPKTLLIRGVGPTLAAFGVTGVLANPELKVFQDGAVVAANDDWGGTVLLKDAFAAVGAVDLASESSHDAALLVTLAPGVYTAQVSGVGGTSGVALVEIYVTP